MCNNFAQTLAHLVLCYVLIHYKKEAYSSYFDVGSISINPNFKSFINYKAQFYTEGINKIHVGVFPSQPFKLIGNLL